MIKCHKYILFTLFQEFEHACFCKDFEEVRQGKHMLTNLEFSGHALFPSFYQYGQHTFYVFQVTNKQVLPIYLKVVESSYFNSSDKVNLQALYFFLLFKM